MEPARITTVLKTRAMQKVERAVGMPLAEYLEEAYRSRTLSQIAQDVTARGVRISDITVARWMREFGIEPRFSGQRPPEAASA